MKGDKIDLGEERAILELYRNSIDPDDQKVYYSVESFVKHYVSPFKMTRRYMLKRYFQSGRAASRIKQKHPAGALRRLVAFIPDQAVFIWKEIRAKGLLKASYTKMLFNFALRVGNIAELLSHGWRPVLGPHIKDKYKRLRVFLKNRGLIKTLAWVDARVNINYWDTADPTDNLNPTAKNIPSK
jgi:hypothetical protein